MTKQTSLFWLFPFVAMALTPSHLAMQESGDRKFLLRLEREIVAEHNRARSDPSGYAAHLGDLKRYSRKNAEFCYHPGSRAAGRL